MISRIITYFCFFLILAGCQSFQDPIKSRNELAKKNHGDIEIAAVINEKSQRNGILLAQELINQSGGFQGQKIKIHWFDDESDITKGRLIAQKIADNKNIIAVIGHQKSYISIPVSSIYEFAGIVMISPKSTASVLTKQGYHYIFRSLPNDDNTGQQMARLMIKQGLKNCAILYVKNDYGKGLANAFEKEANAIGLTVLDRVSYLGFSDQLFEDIILNWKELAPEAIFIAGTFYPNTPPAPSIFIKKARLMGLKSRFFGGDGLDSPLLWEAAGKLANGTIIPGFYHNLNTSANATQFQKVYIQRFKGIPDTWSAKGFDSLQILFKAIQLSYSTQPKIIAQKLHKMPLYEGAAGHYQFDLHGDMMDQSISYKVVTNNHFEYIRTK